MKREGEAVRKQCVFGPILSRRLGSSLGVNLVPYKTCNFDCVYCECGPTLQLVVERKEYLPSDLVIATLKEAAWRLKDHRPLCVTFAGWGEPTLHISLGAIAEATRRIFPKERLVLITNGALFARYRTLLEEVQVFDLVIPSLDAGREETFTKINRPHPSLGFAEHLESLHLLRQHFTKDIWLEVFVVPGVNDTPEELKALQKHLQTLSPERIHINSLDRRPTCEWVQAPSQERLEEIACFLGGEVIPPVGKTKGPGLSSGQRYGPRESRSTPR